MATIWLCAQDLGRLGGGGPRAGHRAGADDLRHRRPRENRRVLHHRAQGDRPRRHEKNLREVGYDTWTKIFFKPTTNIMLTTTGFKIDTRRQL